MITLLGKLISNLFTPFYEDDYKQHSLIFTNVYILIKSHQWDAWIDKNYNTVNKIRIRPIFLLKKKKAQYKAVQSQQ